MPETVPLFNKVAKHYDSLNTFFSLGMDSQWRRQLTQELAGSKSVLDIATGTGEVAIQAVKNLSGSRIIGMDPSAEMLALAQKKIQAPGVAEKVSLAQGSAEDLPFKDNTFDGVSIAFGIRNTRDHVKSLGEMRRVLKPGGRVAILEFAIPRQRLFAPVYLFYFKNIMPLVASIFGNKNEYKYLSDSTSAFPQRETFMNLLQKSGFKAEKSIELMLGIVIIYVGVKT